MSSHGLQLGETEAQISARHGAPRARDQARQQAVYEWKGWSAQIEFQNGVADKLTYRADHQLADGEIQALLQANGGAARWRETTSPGAALRQWVRDDQAVAVIDAAPPTGMIFQTVALHASALTPAETIVAESFLKFDTQAGTPASATAPAASRHEPAVQSNASHPQLRSTSELRTEPIAGEPPAAPVATVKSPDPASLPATPSPGSRVPWGLLGAGAAGLVLLGAALAWWFARRKNATPLVTPARPVPRAPAAEPPKPVAASVPGLDALRGDQIELLLGEIFRRQGYAIDLSAALSADGGSDLTLRRDGESIPVRSQDWKAARVTEREVRELYGLMAATAAPRGILVTMGTFSRDAREFAEDKSIELIDRSGLEERIAAVQRPEENFCDVAAWIGDFTSYARIFDPECPCCGQSMVMRRHRTDGTDSWVCATYPRCAGTRAARRDLVTLPAAA